jgi:hypothetical protein
MLEMLVVTRLKTVIIPVRFQVLTAASMKMAVFWDVAPCSLVDIGRRFTGAYCPHHQGDETLIAVMMGTVSTFETSADIYQTTRRNIPEDNHLVITLCTFLNTKDEYIST